MAIMKQIKLIKRHQTIKNTNEHKFFYFFCKNLYFIQRNDKWTLNTERMRNDYIFSLERNRIQGFIFFFCRIWKFSGWEVQG